MTNKVLFTASTFSHIVNFHLSYLRWFRERGWEVHVACGGKAMLIPHADRVIFLPFRKRMGSAENFKAAGQLRKLIREERYDLISAHSSLAAFFTRLAVKKMRNRPLVVNTVHGYLFDEKTPAMQRRILLAAERLTAPETDLLMTMNEWDYQLAKKEKLGKRVERIPGMGVDFARLDSCDTGAGKELRRKLGILEDAFVLIYPAEFSQRKSQEVLIEAMAELPERAVLVLPGEGALLERCKALASERNLRGRRPRPHGFQLPPPTPRPKCKISRSSLRPGSGISAHYLPLRKPCAGIGEADAEMIADNRIKHVMKMQAFS